VDLDRTIIFDPLWSEKPLADCDPQLQN